MKNSTMPESKEFISEFLLGALKVVPTLYCIFFNLYLSLETYKLTESIFFAITLGAWFMFSSMCVLYRHIYKKKSKMATLDGFFVVLIKAPLINVGTYVFLILSESLKAYLNPFIALAIFYTCVGWLMMIVVKPLKKLKRA